MAYDFSNHDWEAAKAKVQSAQLPAGAYVCKIVNAAIEEMKNGDVRLTLDIDIIEGDYAGHFSRLVKDGKWDFRGKFKRYLKKNGEVFPRSFVSLITDLEKQNPNFVFDTRKIEESNFKNLISGFVFGEREYEANDGSIKIGVNIRYSCLADKVRDGSVKIPAVEGLNKPIAPKEDYSKEFNNTSISDDDLPF